MCPENKPIRVLFVCTGNICRSPLAEGVFRHMVAHCGLSERITTESAGMIRYHAGEAPDSRAQATALSAGIDIAAQCARQITMRDFDVFDYLIALDRGHKTAMEEMAPKDARDRIHLLMGFAPQSPETDVPDPFYGGQEDFDRVLEMIEVAASGLLAEVRQELD